MNDDQFPNDESDMNDLPDDGFPDELEETDEALDHTPDTDSGGKGVVDDDGGGRKSDGIIGRLLSNHFKKVVGAIITVFAVFGYLIISGGDQPTQQTQTTQPQQKQPEQFQGQQTPTTDPTENQVASQNTGNRNEADQKTSDQGLLFDSEELDRQTQSERPDNSDLGNIPVPEPIDSMEMDFDLPTPDDDRVEPQSEDQPPKSDQPDGQLVTEQDLPNIDQEQTGDSTDAAGGEAIGQSGADMDDLRQRVMSRLDEILSQVTSTKDQLSTLQDRVEVLADDVNNLEKNKVSQDRIIDLSNQLSQLESELTEVKKDTVQSSDGVVVKESQETAKEGSPGPTQTTQEDDDGALNKKESATQQDSVSKTQQKPQNRISQRWVLKSATPDSAWIAQRDGTNMRRVTIGDDITGIGRVEAIERGGDGWVVRGSQSSVRP
jgi:hypothetical protein